MSDGCWVCWTQPAHVHPSTTFASGLSSLAWSWVLDENRNEFSGKSGEASSSSPQHRTDPSLGRLPFVSIIPHPGRRKSLLRSWNKLLKWLESPWFRVLCQTECCLRLRKYLRHSVHLHQPRALFEFVAMGFTALPSHLMACPKQACALWRSPVNLTKPNHLLAVIKTCCCVEKKP